MIYSSMENHKMGKDKFSLNHTNFFMENYKILLLRDIK